MTTLSKDEIIAWAREAIDYADEHHEEHGTWIDAERIKFATLCRADLVAENERLQEKSAKYNISAWIYCMQLEDAIAECDELRAENDRLADELNAMKDWKDAMRDKMEALKAKPKTERFGGTEELIIRLRDTPNWQREDFTDWKTGTSFYDRAPFEAADRIEELKAELSALRSGGGEAVKP